MLKFLNLPKRALNLQEYHSKNLLAKYNCTIQPFYTANTPEQAKTNSTKLLENGASEIVLKAQILAGGRGKGHFLPNGFKGGVKLSTDVDEIENLAGKMLGQRLVTKQTNKEGVLVDTVMVAHALNIERELYLAILMDRESNGPVVIASPAGGMDIEKVAEETPELIYKMPININKGIHQEATAAFVDFFTSQLDNGNFPEDLKTQLTSEIINLYNLFINVDATQVEINPMGITDDQKVVCFDAKINFDDCAEFRQKEIFALEKENGEGEVDPREQQANEAGLNFIPLDGNIACVVNGAGLAMATMDMIKLHGGNPANFLDLGGGVNTDGVTKAFDIILQDEKVETILVNIFGGIVNCATVAQGIIDAYQNLSMDKPVIVRLEGTNVENAMKLINEAGIEGIRMADGFETAAKLAIASAESSSSDHVNTNNNSASN